MIAQKKTASHEAVPFFSFYRIFLPHKTVKPPRIVAVIVMAVIPFIEMFVFCMVITLSS